MQQGMGYRYLDQVLHCAKNEQAITMERLSQVSRKGKIPFLIFGNIFSHKRRFNGKKEYRGIPREMHRVLLLSN